MKIIIFTPYWLNTKGGITTVSEAMYRNLKQIKNEVFVLTPDGGKGAIKIFSNRFLLPFDAVWKFKEIKPDVVHIHSSGFFLLPAILYKFFFNRKTKIIFTFHTQPRINLSTKIAFKERGSLGAIFLGLLLRKCDDVTCVSRSMADSFRKTGIKGVNPLIIYNGVEERAVNRKEIADFKEEYYLDGAYPILCMVGVFSWDWKIEGVKILIRAFQKIFLFYPTAKLLIVGEGKYKSILEEFINKNNLKEKVVLIGMMQNPFLAFAVADIYCHISLNESFGLSILEAMIAAKPVIASNEGGIPEIVKNNYNGILVESSPEIVADAVISLSKNSELRHKLAMNAIKTAKEKYSWKTTILEYMKIYQT